MSRKFSLIPLGIVVLVGAVWASSGLFPNTTEFPSSPGGIGTLSGALSHFDASGNAKNTLKLWGRTASGYLKQSVCIDPAAVWRGIDTNGQAICAKNLPILSIGTFYELTPGCAEVMKSGTTTWVAGNGATALKSGDIVRTKNTVACDNTTTIRFAADDSILRLDRNTLVELQTGELGGNTVAQAILQNGSLWWRILTSTGVNIGGGGLVAGVRGTSVRVDRFNWFGPTADSYRISIVHSRITSSSTPPATISRVDNSDIVTTANIGDNYIYAPITPELGANTEVIFKVAPYVFTSQNPTLNQNLNGSEDVQWLDYFYGNTSSSLRIKQNTIKDIKYLASLRNSLPSGSRKDLAMDELVHTEPPPTEFSLRRDICGTGLIYSDVTNICVFWYMDIESTQWKMMFGSGNTTDYGFPEWTPLAANNSTKRSSNNIWDKWITYGALTNYNQILGWGDPAWTPGRRPPTRPFRFAELNNVLSFIPSCSLSKTFCKFLRTEWQGNGYIWTIVQTIPAHTAVVENEWSNASYTYSGVYLVRNTPGAATLAVVPDTNIDATWEYLQYLGESWPTLSQLAGKTITIELGWAVGTTGKKYLADFWGTLKFYIDNGELKCAHRLDSTCQSWDFVQVPWSNSYKLYLPTAPTQFIIGNIYNPSLATTLNGPIWTTIQKVIITN